MRNNFSLNEWFQFEQARGHSRGYAIVTWLKIQTFSSALRSTISQLQKLNAPCLDQSRKKPYSRVLHGRVERLSRNDDFRRFVEEELNLNDIVRLLSGFDILGQHLERLDPEGTEYQELYSQMQKETTARKASLLAMFLIDSNAKPYHQRSR